MRHRSHAVLGLLLACCAPWSPASAQSGAQSEHAATSAAAPVHAPRARVYQGVRDTGQFLPDTAILGRIDDRVFRVGEFVERWFASYMLDRPRTDSAGRHEFLRSMVNKEVLAALARTVDRPLSFEDRAVLREARQRFLSNVVFARLVADSVRYTDDEVRRLYEQNARQLRLQRIVAADPATVERARADVVERRLPWADAVRQYSKDPEARGPDGDMGWVQRNALPPAVALEVFDLPDGGVSSVFREGRRWWFARVAERRPNQQPSLELTGKLFAKELLGVKLSQRAERLRAEVRERIGMRYDSTNIYWAAALFAEKEREIQGDDPTPVLDLTAHVPDFQPADTSRVLVRWRDGVYSLGDFLTEYNATPIPQRERVGTFGTFRSTLDRHILEPYMAQLATERGLEDDSIVVVGMAKKEEQIRVEHLFADSVEARLWVSKEERRRYYEEHLPDFFGLQSVTYAALGRDSKAGVDSVVARLEAGERAADILRADSLAGRILGSIRTEGERDGGEFHSLLFEEMREGDVRILGPNQQGEYLLFQKLAHDPGRQLTLEEVQSLVDESVQNLKAERLLQELVARHLPKHDIELHPELLMRVRLADPRD